MKKRKTLTRLLCATVSVATVATLGGMALADETDVEVEETVEIVEEQPEEEAEVVAEETEAEETEAEETEAPEEEAVEEEADEAEEIVEEVEVIEDEVVVDVIVDEEALEPEAVEAAEEAIEVEEETIIFEEAAEGKNGWVHDDYGNWYYYIDDVKQYGWLTVGGKTYYLDDYDGRMVVGSRVIDSKYYIFGTNGAMLTGWVNYDYDWYYCTANGAETGWNKHGKNWYYFDRDIEDEWGPYMYWGTIESIGDYSYAFDGNGVMLTGWCQPYLYEDDEDWYYCDSSGHVQTGWQKIGGKWYYLGTEMYTGFCEIYNSEIESYEYYYFNENGVMQTGWVSSECPYGTGTYWYYFESSGKAAEGWKKLSKKWYYFRNGMAATGMTYVEGQYYYFGLPLKEDGSANPNVGVMQTGWISEQVMDYYGVETAWYYFNANGTMATGWKKIGSNWYYFYEDSGLKGYNRTGRMVTGFIWVYNESTESSDCYFFSANGVMQTNHWVKDEGYWYYFGSNGIEAKGWTQINGKWYYLDPDMFLGLHFIDGVLYDFGTDGVCVNPPEDPTNTDHPVEYLVAK